MSFLAGPIRAARGSQPTTVPGMRQAAVEPFTPRTSPEEIEELRARLRATRWPDAPQDAGWSMGVDVGYLRGLVEYWADGFDWEAALNRIAGHPRFRVDVGGLRIHCAHVRAAGLVPALPLVLTHGWPDGSWRYSKVIDLLTDPGAHRADPADAFDVVVPDIPGFGWSDRPARPLNTIEVADLWAVLMTVLGYERFGAVGGDLGSHVSRFLALNHPDRVVAVHRTDAGLPRYAGDPADLTDAERDWIAGAMAWGAKEGAYAAMHSTKPQTAAVGLTDSPAGLAAWIVEKLWAWSDCGADLESVYSRDEILTLVSTYWFTGTIASSIRMYHANAAISPDQMQRRVEVPSGFSIFGGDVVRPPHAWLERTANVVRATEPSRGGHFAAFEQPELFAQEIRDLFRPFRAAPRRHRSNRSA
jgi:pimeloyl-ACP methyl ester carboxylesterase